MGNAFLNKGVCQNHPKGGGGVQKTGGEFKYQFILFFLGRGCRIIWELFFCHLYEGGYYFCEIFWGAFRKYAHNKLHII